jgi:hypothetical protein
VRVCLRGQKAQRDAFLQSLKSQLEQFVLIERSTLYGLSLFSFTLFSLAVFSCYPGSLKKQ